MVNLGLKFLNVSIEDIPPLPLCGGTCCWKLSYYSFHPSCGLLLSYSASTPSFYPYSSEPEPESDPDPELLPLKDCDPLSSF